MRKLNDPSKQSVPRSTRKRNSALFAAALPLLCGALGCGGSAADSQVGSAGAGFIPISTGPTLDPMMGGSAGNSSSNGGAGSVTTPGTYMLPADFTPATLGGLKLGAAEDPNMTGAAGASTGTPGASCGTQILGVVRDFKGMNEPMGHPDFEHFSG
ncbi:MAG TPA: hypothetical protein VGF76_06720, partial [Polyangiaceae bacterium]